MSTVTELNLSDSSGRGVDQPPLSGGETPKPRLAATVISITAGTTLEYVDFALYGLAAGLVFGPVFYPELPPALALINNYATYAVGFLARPAGALFFGWLGDKIGRKYILIVTLMLMGLSTTCIGLLPSYATAGYTGAILLLVLRLIQGFGAGAELSGGAIMLTETAEPHRRGLVASMIAFGSNGGVILASGSWMLVNLLPEQDVIDWGWRIPFLCSVIVAGAALILRRKMDESPVFLATSEAAQREIAIGQERARADEASATKTGGLKAFFALMGLRIAENGPSYLSQTFIVGYVATYLGMSKSIPTDAVFYGAILGLFAVPVIGRLTDRFGRRVVYRVMTGFLVVFPFIAYPLMDSKNSAVVFIVIVVGFIVASVGMFAAQAAFAAELFGSRNRFKKMALAKEIGSMISGGVASLVAAALLRASGHWWPIAVYFATMAGIGFITTFLVPETRGRDLTDPNDAL